MTSGRIASPTRKRLALLGLIVALTLPLAGCLWLRLLALKNQLADFDRCVQVDERQGLAFHFLYPVLLDRDLRELLVTEPTVIITNGPRQTWLWTFEKIRATNDTAPGNFDLTFSTSFTNSLMDGFAIPERVLAMVPAAFIENVLRSLGHAEIDQQKRSASSHFTGSNGTASFKPITRATVDQLLGMPLQLSDSVTNVTYRYEYRLKTVSHVDLKHRTMMSALVFDRDSGRLRDAREDFAGMQVQLSFDPDAVSREATNAPASR